MGRTVVEATLSSDFPDARLPFGLPLLIAPYLRGFARGSREALKFLWRDEQRWLAIQLTRRTPDAKGRDRIAVSATEVELPQSLTVREVDILTLLALGLTNASIAERFGTSARTVSTQIERLLDRLDQVTRGGLAALAIDSGLVRVPIPGGVGDASGLGIVELEHLAASDSRSVTLASRSPYPKKRPLFVGALVTVGAAASDGQEALNGATLAVEELNQHGGVAGRRVELVTANIDMLNRASVQRGLNRLFDENVDAITTSYASLLSAADIELVADYGRPYLHTATFDEQVRLAEADPSRYGAVFQMCASETRYLSGLARLLTDLESRQFIKPRNKRIVGIEVDVLRDRIFSGAPVDDANRSGWEIDDILQVPATGTDWSAVVERLAQLDPEVVMVFHFLSREVASFQEAFLAAGLSAFVVYVYGPSVPDFQLLAGKAAEGVIWSTTTGTYDDPIGRRFRDQYGRRFGRTPGWSQAGAAYDRVNVLATAWSATDSRETADVVRHLRGRPHRGVNGAYFFGEFNQSTLSYPDATSDPSIGQAHMIYQIQDGIHRPIAPEPFGDLSTFRLPPWRGGVESQR